MESKNILLAVTGGIAAYKACDLASRLSKTCHEVRVIMTEHGSKFVAPLTFEALSGHQTLVELFEEHPEDPIAHISLAKWADVFCIVPATANIIAKIANGIADDLVSTVALAAYKERIICPAMNVHMYENEATQKNLDILRARGWTVIEPVSGLLACKDEGKGKLASVDDIEQAILSALYPKPLSGKKVVITAGPTQESLDPVRFISNHSTGKQGFAVAKAAKALGADVRLITGPVSLDTPYGVTRIDVVSASDMFEAVKRESDADVFVLAAAVGDFRPAVFSEQKIKKKNAQTQVELVQNPDILAWLGQNRNDAQRLVGFAMETEDLEKNARHKLESKGCDLLVANDLFEKGAGFGTDTNSVLFLTKDGTKKLPIQSKEDLGFAIFQEVMKGC